MQVYDPCGGTVSCPCPIFTYALGESYTSVIMGVLTLYYHVFLQTVL